MSKNDIITVEFLSSPPRSGYEKGKRYVMSWPSARCWLLLGAAKYVDASSPIEVAAITPSKKAVRLHSRRRTMKARQSCG